MAVLVRHGHRPAAVRSWLKHERAAVALGRPTNPSGGFIFNGGRLKTSSLRLREGKQSAKGGTIPQSSCLLPTVYIDPPMASWETGRDAPGAEKTMGEP